MIVDSESWWVNGGRTLLPPIEGWQLNPAGIDNAGLIVGSTGYGPVADAYTVGVLLDPVPEPSSVSLALVGIVGILFFRIRAFRSRAVPYSSE